jgi:hypothetical protein
MLDSQQSSCWTRRPPSLWAHQAANLCVHSPAQIGAPLWAWRVWRYLQRRTGQGALEIEGLLYGLLAGADALSGALALVLFIVGPMGGRFGSEHTGYIAHGPTTLAVMPHPNLCVDCARTLSHVLML